MDGGSDPNALVDYIDATGTVLPPFESLIISHAHSDTDATPILSSVSV